MLNEKELIKYDRRHIVKGFDFHKNLMKYLRKLWFSATRISKQI